MSLYPPRFAVHLEVGNFKLVLTIVRYSDHCVTASTSVLVLVL